MRDIEALKEDFRNIPIELWEKQYKQIPKLANLLFADEKIIDARAGYYDEYNSSKNIFASGKGLIVLTGQRIIFSMRDFCKIFSLSVITDISCMDNHDCDTITISSHDGKFVLDEVCQAVSFCQNISSAMNSYKKSSSFDFMKELRELAAMKREGLLTDEEFTLAKKKLLS